MIPDPGAPTAPLALDHIPNNASAAGTGAFALPGRAQRKPQALAHLQKRGLNDPLLIEHFRLGFANRRLGYLLPQANRRAGAELRVRLQQLDVLRESGHEHLGLASADLIAESDEEDVDLD